MKFLARVLASCAIVLACSLASRWIVPYIGHGATYALLGVAVVVVWAVLIRPLGR